MIGKVINKSIATALLGTVAMLFFSACGGSKETKIAAVSNRDSIPQLDATMVTTVVSDSGITRYRVSTEKWLVFDKAKEPYWDFPKGILLENFSPDLKVDASVVSDYAIFLEKKQLWELKGNVVAINLEGEKFETEQLFWDQKKERIYSDSAITISRETSIIKGIGFNSNQTLTKYTILKPQGVIPVKEEKEAQSDSTIETINNKTSHDEITPTRQEPARTKTDSSGLKHETLRRKADGRVALQKASDVNR